ncbi:MAG TPA: hypothetical protein DHW02_24595 [Ktedonobacter sp.]|nr:hypothetical protein [Ktedonobacter sp.]
MSIGPRRIGKYELHTLLGRGGMAEVWKAFDSNLQRYVAIKILHANLQNNFDFIKRFEREARAVASLHHPNIVHVHDFQISRLVEEGNPTGYMVMEYVEGITLAEFIHNTSYEGRFPPPDEIIHLFTSISRAIDYAHQRGIIHRDIKPANILLDKRNPSKYQIGEPILTDFGIFKLLGTSTGTLSGSWMGTPAYISPEQAQGYPGNERSDIYSLGIILYEICTGVRPFQDDNILAIVWHHIHTAPTPPSLVNPYIPKALSEVILRSLAKDPAARFQSASAMADALIAAFADSTSPANSVSTNAASEKPYINLNHLNPLPEVTSSASPQPAIEHSSPVPPVVLSTPKFTVLQTPSAHNSRDSERRTPSTPIITNIPQNSVVESPSASHRLRKSKLPLLLAFLCIVLISSSLGGFYFLHKSSNPVPPTNQIVGNAIFVSSGQSSVSSSQGLYDQLQMDLHDIQSPASGKSYYAWLLGADSSELCPPLNIIPSIFMGKLTVDRGNVHFSFKGDQQHDDLLGLVSGLLITEENTSITPDKPSADKSTWRYSAALPQGVSDQVTNSSSFLENLRCLLYDQPALISQGIHGGLETPFFGDIQQVMNAARSASYAFTNGDTRSMHHQVMSILEYIDGLTTFKEEVPGESPPQPNDKRAQIGLISLQQSFGDFSDYGDRISNFLGSMVLDPGVTPNMQKLVNQAKEALSNVQRWLQMVHTYALQFVHIPENQLLQPSTDDTLNAILTYAQYADNGHIDSSAGISQSGASQLDQNIQGLATFEIKQ